MKVKELIELLQKQDQELPVRLITDHGQTLMECFQAGEGYLEEDSHMGEEIHPDDYNEEEYPDAVKVFVLEG